MPEAGDVITTRVRFADNEGTKIRPVLFLYEELGNIVIVGISTNLRMKGVPITKAEGAAQDSVIKLNYIFTITSNIIIKTVFHLSKDKKESVFEEIREKLGSLNS